jgi:sporulation protein YlmC with PRC-barrel domain
MRSLIADPTCRWNGRTPRYRLCILFILWAELALDESWVRVSDQVKGHEVADYSGTRIGTINDVVINCEGRIVGYNLSEILADSPAIVEGRIPVQYSRSFGPDILLVDTTHRSRMDEAAHAETSGAGGVEASRFSIKGVGKGYADLLAAAGVDTVPELAERAAESLHQKLLEANEERRLVRRPPTLAQVKGWAEQARQFPRRVTY